MQTFLPLAGFQESARVLDPRRLGKQRVEARGVIDALRGSNGWSRHPAVLMWAGYEDALIAYGNAMIEEWVKRGYRNNMLVLPHGRLIMPPWFGDRRFHASHRSNLLRKAPGHYSQFGWLEPSTLPYFWPTKEY